jgi:prepilin-type N-terminal cleavage/methylation domain-containing protein
MNARGFSLIELLVTMAITIAITIGMFSFIHSARGIFEVDLEHTDIQQRARVATDALFRDLVMAGAGLQSPAVAPYRRGSINPDMPGSAFPDRVSVLYVPPDTAGPVMVTYGRRVDAAGVPHLTRYDGAASEMPLVDQVSDLRFEYFDLDGQLIVMDRFADGPWVPDAVSADRFDADLWGIRRIRAFVRLRPARVFAAAPLADLEIATDVSPRNLNLQ